LKLEKRGDVLRYHPGIKNRTRNILSINFYPKMSQ
jgi:hypothetical protein